MVSLTQTVVNFAGQFMSPGGENGRLSILFYHRVLAKPDPLMPDVIDAAGFDRHMRALSKVFNVLPLEEATDRLYNGTITPLTLSITFDDGYLDNLEVAVPILQRHKMHATFYLTTGFMNGTLMYNDVVIEAVRRMPAGDVDLNWLGLGVVAIADTASRMALAGSLIKAVKYLEATMRNAACVRLAAMCGESLPDNLMMNADHVARLGKSGMAIGGHTVDHPILAKISDDEAWKQILQNRDDLTAITGERPRLFAYPNGKPGNDYEARHIHMVAQAGYTSAVSTGWGAVTPTVDRFQMPRLSPWDRSETMFIARVLKMARASDKGNIPVVEYPITQG